MLPQGLTRNQYIHLPCYVSLWGLLHHPQLPALPFFPSIITEGKFLALGQTKFHDVFEWEGIPVPLGLPAGQWLWPSKQPPP